MRAKKKAEPQDNMVEILNLLEKEKGISKESLLQAIEDSLQQAYKYQHHTDNSLVTIDPETCQPHIYQVRKVVEEVENPETEITQQEAFEYDSTAQIGDDIRIEIDSKQFSRIAAHTARNTIVQKIREQERSLLYNEYKEKEKHVVTGTVQRVINNNVSIDLGRTDALLTEREMVPGETLKPNERVKVYIKSVTDTPKGPRIIVSRKCKELVACLFEEEVAEIQNGIIEVRAIAREAGSRTKIAVWSNDENVDAVGACVGIKGSRVDTIVDELDGEKIDIINWDENEAQLIENALSPAKVITVLADQEDRQALVVVPDYQLSLAIGKEGQNARLAARLTGYKIDIKNETQAREEGIFDAEEAYGEDAEEDNEEESSFEESAEDYDAADEAVPENDTDDSTELTDADPAEEAENAEDSTETAEDALEDAEDSAVSEDAQDNADKAE